MKLSDLSITEIAMLSNVERARLEEPENAEALDKTGFWGKAAAGCILLAKDTGRIGIALRGPEVEQPGTWGTIGGAVVGDATPAQTVRKETPEEIGYTIRPTDKLVPLDVFESGEFRYTTFVLVVQGEFEAKLNWENKAFAWFDFGNWPRPLHFGLQKTLDKPECQSKLQTLVQEVQYS